MLCFNEYVVYTALPFIITGVIFTLKKCFEYKLNNNNDSHLSSLNTSNINLE